MAKKLVNLLLNLSLVLNLNSNLSAQYQVVDSFSYSGGPYDIRTTQVHTTPGTELRFIFCSLNVPDHLEVSLCGQAFKLYVGAHYIDPKADEGYLYYRFVNNQLILLSKLSQTPIDIVNQCSVCRIAHGAVVIDITVPEGCCLMEWTVTGNHELPTIYTLKVQEIFRGNAPIVDTIYSYSCLQAYQKIESIECERYLYVYRDSSIKEVPIITQPKCGKLGSIVFPNFPEKNLYNLHEGEYNILLSNKVCEKRFDFFLEDSSICNYYFPNVISTTSVENNRFSLFFDKPLKYELFIYDRWGSLLYRQELISDSGLGWDGYYKNNLCPPGVYVWRAVVHADQIYHYSGDVTLLN